MSKNLTVTEENALRDIFRLSQGNEKYSADDENHDSDVLEAYRRGQKNSAQTIQSGYDG
jgi:hypothetical protein